jgi:hypothetical protein
LVSWFTMMLFSIEKILSPFIYYPGLAWGPLMNADSG